MSKKYEKINEKGRFFFLKHIPPPRSRAHTPPLCPDPLGTVRSLASSSHHHPPPHPHPHPPPPAPPLRFAPRHPRRHPHSSTGCQGTGQKRGRSPHPTSGGDARLSRRGEFASGTGRLSPGRGSGAAGRSPAAAVVFAGWVQVFSRGGGVCVCVCVILFIPPAFRCPAEAGGPDALHWVRVRVRVRVPALPGARWLSRSGVFRGGWAGVWEGGSRWGWGCGGCVVRLVFFFFPPCHGFILTF